MTIRILAVFDRTPLGHLAVETAFQSACSKAQAEVHVLAIPTTPGDAEQQEALHDDLVAFAQVGRRLGVLMDGAIVEAPDTARIVAEIRQRKIDRLVIAKPARQTPDTAIDRLLDAAANVAGISTLVVRGDDQ